MKYKVGDRIRPKVRYVSGKGTVWESILEEYGYNDLPADKKDGVITRYSEEFEMIDEVYWEGLDLHLKIIVFPDEVLESHSYKPAKNELANN